MTLATDTFTDDVVVTVELLLAAGREELTRRQSSRQGSHVAFKDRSAHLEGLAF
jgi:hypothetical protein